MIAHDVDAIDRRIALRIGELLGPAQNRGRRKGQRQPACHTGRANGCLCSNGCPTSWLRCRPSKLCNASAAALGAPPLLPWPNVSDCLTADNVIAEDHGVPRRTGDVAILLYLTFKSTTVRRRFMATSTTKRSSYFNSPLHAYTRERRRIECFLHSALRVRTHLPIYIVVGGERNLTQEARLTALGARILPGPFVEPPPWASSFHRMSFNRISALSFTQFSKVIVMDNDMKLLQNIDLLAEHAETPGLVWHPAARFMLDLGERCSVTGGLFVLAPSAREYTRARRHLEAMYASSAASGNASWLTWSGRPSWGHLGKQPFRYDGSDQEFWRSFYAQAEVYELPVQFHATTVVSLNESEWRGVRVLHMISGFQALERRFLPPPVRRLMKHLK